MDVTISLSIWLLRFIYRTCIYIFTKQCCCSSWQNVIYASNSTKIYSCYFNFENNTHIYTCLYLVEYWNNEEIALHNHLSKWLQYGQKYVWINIADQMFQIPCMIVRLHTILAYVEGIIYNCWLPLGRDIAWNINL